MKTLKKYNQFMKDQATDMRDESKLSDEPQPLPADALPEANESEQEEGRNENNI